MRRPEERTPDRQYLSCLEYILKNGEVIKTTPQGVGAITDFTAPKIWYDLDNGFPIITERNAASFWRKAIDELFSFVRGEITFDGLREAGCGWWDQWRENAEGMQLGDTLGKASYGGAFHDFPMPDGSTFNQFQNLVKQMEKFPEARTHFITPWIPFWLVRGENQQAVVAPCHGWIHARNVNGKLVIHMFQRSCDFPVGVPSNIIQYAAFTQAFASQLGLKPWQYVHSFSDAHIYENQVENVNILIKREPRTFPTVRLIRPVTDIFKVDSSWFELEDYNPHPGMRIPVAT